MKFARTISILLWTVLPFPKTTANLSLRNTVLIRSHFSLFQMFLKVNPWKQMFDCVTIDTYSPGLNLCRERGRQGFPIDHSLRRIAVAEGVITSREVGRVVYFHLTTGCSWGFVQNRLPCFTAYRKSKAPCKWNYCGRRLTLVRIITYTQVIFVTANWSFLANEPKIQGFVKEFEL